jgi:integrase
LRLLPTPRGTIELRTKPTDHRVHQRKDGRWCCRVTIKDPGESRGRLRSFYFKERWRAVAKLIQVDPSAGRWHIDDENMTVGDWLKRWLENGRAASGAPWRPKTLEFNTFLVRHYSRPLHEIMLSDLAESNVRDWLGGLRRKDGEPLKATAKHDVHITLGAALNAAVKRRHLEKNPIAGLRLTELSPPKRLTENVTWSRAEVDHFVAGIKGDRFEALYLVALGLGLRQGEILGLIWDDIDLESERLYVRHQLQHNGRWQLVPPKTRNSLRTVVLTGNPALTALHAHKKQWMRGSVNGLENLVFLTAAGAPIDSHNLAKVFKRRIAGLGLPRIVFHELRSIFTTRNLDAGVPSNQVADMLGDSLAMVETYRRRHIDTQRAAHKAVWSQAKEN